MFGYEKTLQFIAKRVLPDKVPELIPVIEATSALMKCVVESLGNKPIGTRRCCICTREWIGSDSTNHWDYCQFKLLEDAIKNVVR